MDLKISQKTHAKTVEFTFEGKTVCRLLFFSDGAVYVNQSERVNVMEGNIRKIENDNGYHRIYLH